MKHSTKFFEGWNMGLLWKKLPTCLEIQGIFALRVIDPEHTLYPSLKGSFGSGEATLSKK